MADTLLNLQAATLPSPYCYPASVQTLLNDFATYLQAIFPGTLTTFAFGDSVPADTTVPWIRTVSGYFEGVYVYQGGKWLRPHPTPASGSERRIWVGTVNDLKTYDGGVDEAVTSTTGPMWEIDTNFDFKMPLGCGATGSATNTTAYDGNPATVKAIAATGGEERHTLVKAELPSDDCIVTPGTLPNTVVGDASGNTGNGFSYNTNGEVVPSGNLTVALPGSDESHENMPPYTVVAFIKRTGRIYYTV